MTVRTERERTGAQRRRVWRKAGDCPWWRGGAVSMRWAGRLWAGPDGLAAGLQAAVCARQTVAEGDYHPHSASPREVRRNGESDADSCEETAKYSLCRHLEKHRRRRRAPPPLYPTPRRQPALSFPLHHFVPSLWSELPPLLGESRLPKGNPCLTSVAMKRCFEFLTESPFSVGLSSAGAVQPMDLGVYTFLRVSTGMIW